MRYAFFLDLDVVSSIKAIQNTIERLDGRVLIGKLYNYRPTRHKGLRGLAEKYQLSLELASKGKSCRINIQQAIDSIECAMTDRVEGILMVCKGKDSVAVLSKIAEYNKRLVIGIYGNDNKLDDYVCDDVIRLDEWGEEIEDNVVVDKQLQFDFLPYTNMECDQDLTKLNAQLGELIESKKASKKLKKVKNDKLDDLIEKYF